MKCHYEVLQVDRNSSEDEVKKSYRRLALIWHPDKNPDNIDECTEYFAIIQQAYDILSDSHERAWYDKHREDILRGGLGEHYKDESLNLFPYFTSSCYSGYGDDEKGFYAVYGDVFQVIAQEDLDFIENSVDNSYPPLGGSNCSYDEVVAHFYAFWQSFTTSKSYAWLNKYDIRQAANRPMARAMEKENRKLREMGRRQRNEQVRELVAFVRKRDKRLLLYRKLLEEKRFEQEKRTDENRKNQIRQRLREMQDYKTTIFENSDERENSLLEIEQHLNEQFGDEFEVVSNNSDSVENDKNSAFYCIVCEKCFKSENGLANHEKSRKHRETLSELRKHMHKDDFSLLDDLDTSCSRDTPGVANGKKSKKQRRKNRNQLNVDEHACDFDKNCSDSDEGNSVSEIFTCDKLKIEIDRLEIAPESGDRGEKNTKNAKNAKQPNQKRATCDFCLQIFESRSKLFQHLDESGHASVKTGTKCAKSVSKRR